MSRASVIQERYAMWDTYLSNNGYGHTTVDAYPMQEVLALVIAYWRTGESKYLTHCENQWTYCKSFVNANGFFVYPILAPNIGRDPSFRTVVYGIDAARLLRHLGATGLAAEIIAACDVMAKGYIDHEATWAQTITGAATYGSPTATIFASVTLPVAPFTRISTATVDANQNSEVALGFAMLCSEPTTAFGVAGAYRTRALFHVDEQARMVLAYQRSDGRIPIGDGYLSTYDTVYGRYTLGLIAQLAAEMGDEWSRYSDAITYCTRGVSWLNASYSTEPTLGGGYYYVHSTPPTELALAEPVAVLGLTLSTGDIMFTDGKMIDPTTRYILSAYTSAGNGTQATFQEQQEANIITHTQNAELRALLVAPATYLDADVLLLNYTPPVGPTYLDADVLLLGAQTATYLDADVLLLHEDEPQPVDAVWSERDTDALEWSERTDPTTSWSER